MHGAAVAGEQEARQRRGQHHRIADDDVADGAADLVLRPGHRHHARGAGEVGNVEHDFGGAVGSDGDEAGIERERLLRRRAALQLGGGGVAAGPDLAARALHAVDELAVEVAQFGAEPALAEIIVVRRRRLVVGEVEDADIDRGDDDARVLAGGEPADLHRNAQRAAGPHQLRQLHVHRKRMRLAIDREPLHADGAARHPLGAGVERTAQRRHHIGAAAPVAADRNGQVGDARRHVLRGGGDEPVADHVERDLAGGARGDGDRHACRRARIPACRARSPAGRAYRRWRRHRSRRRRRSRSPVRCDRRSRLRGDSGPTAPAAKAAPAHRRRR